MYNFQLSFGFLNPHIACWRLRRHFRRSTGFAEYDLGVENSKVPFSAERIVVGNEIFPKGAGLSHWPELSIQVVSVKGKGKRRERKKSF